MKEKYIQISSRKYLLWVIILSISVRILCMVAFEGWEFKSKRDYGYEGGAIGAALAAGQGYSYPPNNPFNSKETPVPTSWDPPVYASIIAAVFHIFGIYSSASAVFLLIFQTITSALNCVLLFIIGRRVFNAWVGLIGALMFALYPPAIHYAIQKITTANLIVFMLLLIIVQLLNLAEETTLRKSVLVGFTFGIATLTEPVIFASFPFAIAWLLFNRRSELKTRIVSVAFIFLAVCFIMTPWQIRCYSVFGKFFFVQSNFSRELFMGNFANKKSFNDERKYKTDLDEGQRSELYWKKAMSSIVKNPERLFRLTFQKFKRFWIKPPQLRDNRTRPIGIKEFVVIFSYVFILTVGAAGLCLTLLRGREVQLLAMLILSLPIPYYLTYFANFRYRLPVEVILIFFASNALHRFGGLLKVKMPLVTLR